VPLAQRARIVRWKPSAASPVRHIYQSYLNLGMLADAAENEVYTMRGEQSPQHDHDPDGHGRWSAEPARGRQSDPDDLRKLMQVRAINALLRTQAKELRLYWDTPEKDVERTQGPPD